MRRLISKILKKTNYRIEKDRSHERLPKDFLETYRRIAPFTMVDESGAFAVWQAVEYVHNRNIEGALVECGVWRGGISILLAQRLKALGVTNRQQFLYDTFEGMPPPTEEDRDKHGVPAEDQLMITTRRDGGNNVWAYASIEHVRANFETFGFSAEEAIMVKGKVEETIPDTVPEKISVLRLDTDWYESTKHELIHLYPLLAPGGVLLIDDYSYWSGCRKAVEEYFSTDAPRPYMSFLPNWSVVAIKH